MGLFDCFRSKSSKGFDIASIVQQMFDESGITPHREGNIFMTEVDGTNCTFQVFLQCDEKQSNRLSIYAPFILPVPAHVVCGFVRHILLQGVLEQIACLYPFNCI